MTDPYRTMPTITIGQRYSDPIGRTFTIRDHRVLDDGTEQWLGAYDHGESLWESEYDITQWCDRL